MNNTINQNTDTQKLIAYLSGETNDTVDVIETAANIMTVEYEGFRLTDFMNDNFGTWMCRVFTPKNEYVARFRGKSLEELIRTVQVHIMFRDCNQ